MVGNITDIGFDAFSATTLIQSYVGIPSLKLADFKKFIIKTCEIPADKVDAFNEMWDWTEFTEGGTWQYDNTAYTTDSFGTAKYLTVMYSKDFATDKYTFFVADIKGTFNVAQDMYVW